MAKPPGIDHELLDVDRIGGVGATVENVETWNRKQPGGGAAEIAIEGEAGGGGCRPSHCQGNRQHGVGSEPGLVGRGIEIEHHLIDRLLAVASRPRTSGAIVLRMFSIAFCTPFAQVAAATVSQFDRLFGPSRGARRHSRPAEAAVGEVDLGFDRGIASGVEDLAGDDGADDAALGHGRKNLTGRSYLSLVLASSQRASSSSSVIPSKGPIASITSKRSMNLSMVPERANSGSTDR